MTYWKVRATSPLLVSILLILHKLCCFCITLSYWKVWLVVWKIWYSNNVDKVCLDLGISRSPNNQVMRLSRLVEIWLCKCLFDAWCFWLFRESLIRAAFQSLQLVVTDFLPSMSCSCLQICIEVAAKFGLQNQELNISLTAVGLLVWTLQSLYYKIYR